MWHVVIEYFLIVHLCPWPPGNLPHAFIPHGIKRNASDASVFIQRSLYRSLYRSSCPSVLSSFVGDLGEWGEQSGRMLVPGLEILKPECIGVPDERWAWLGVDVSCCLLDSAVMV